MQRGAEQNEQVEHNFQSFNYLFISPPSVHPIQILFQHEADDKLEQRNEYNLRFYIPWKFRNEISVINL